MAFSTFRSIATLRALFSVGFSVLLVTGCDPVVEHPQAVVAAIPADAKVEAFAVGVHGATVVETIPGDLATLNPLVNESAAGSAAIGRI
jgi:hypothetical protein